MARQMIISNRTISLRPPILDLAVTLVSFTSTCADRTHRAFEDIFSHGPSVPPLPNRPNPRLDVQEGFGGPRFPGGISSPGDVRMDLSAILHHLLLTLHNPNAVHGDAVHSLEALDRIITSLMEDYPQSNAAPHASHETISKLPRKKLDEEILGREIKGKCTVCIDDVGLGDEVVVLPCKHWFHYGCVVLWLKEHNTCPICRASVEGERAGESQRNEVVLGLEAELSPTPRSGAAGRHSSTSPSMDPPLPRPSRVRGPSNPSRRSTSGPLRARFTGDGPLYWIRATFGRNSRS